MYGAIQITRNPVKVEVRMRPRPVAMSGAEIPRPTKKIYTTISFTSEATCRLRKEGGLGLRITAKGFSSQFSMLAIYIDYCCFIKKWKEKKHL